MLGDPLPYKIISTHPISNPKAKEILRSIGEENLDQFQKRTLDYTTKFSKVDAEKAEKLVKELTTRFELTEVEAIEIVNCMPKSIEELRVFLAGGRRIVETSKLELILDLLNKYRESED